MSKTIIGLVGPFGSGCSFLAEHFIQSKGYQYIKLSDILKEEYKKKDDFPENKVENPSRRTLQAYGDFLRKTKGGEYLSTLAYNKIKESPLNKWIVDSIRNPAEIDFLKKETGEFFVINVYADQEERWKRVSNKYDGDKRIFEEDDNRDKDEHVDYGQKVEACFLKADIAISNNEKIVYTGTTNDAYKDMAAKIDNYLGLIEGKKEFVPSEMEAVMAIAFANGARSSCLQRKVGAALIDSSGQLFSSGFNEVPKDTRTCEEEHGQCYRKYIREGVHEKVKQYAKDITAFEKIKELYKTNFKNLDYCRALHAEEVAILSVARNGGSFSLPQAHLFSTTYPCNLCANKIVQVGIKKVTYLEPYPMQEAKAIFKINEVEMMPFEGILFNGYFRFKKGAAS